MSNLLEKPSLGRKVVIGEYRADIEADREIEKRLPSVFLDVNVVTTTEGKKLVPIQELLKIEDQLKRGKEEVAKESYDKGFQEGNAIGLEKGHMEAQEVVDNFSSLINDIVRQRETIFGEARTRALELILAISRKVTFDAVKVDEKITSKIIDGTIDSLINKSQIKIKVNPSHLPGIEEHIDRFKGESTAIKEISIEADNRVKHGGCFIETPTGDIDARVESQMEIIAESFVRDDE